MHGLDSSADVLAKLRRTAAERGIDVTVHRSTIEQMDLGTTFRSIFLAGPTFDLIVDDATAGAALARIRDHLDPTGAALIPLFIPEPVPERHLGRVRGHVDDRGRTLRVTATSTDRDEAARLQTTVLRYEIVDGDDHQVIERPWILHWHTPAGFRELVAGARWMSARSSGPMARPQPTTPRSSPSCSDGRPDRGVGRRFIDPGPYPGSANSVTPMCAH